MAAWIGVYITPPAMRLPAIAHRSRRRSKVARLLDAEGAVGCSWWKR